MIQLTAEQINAMREQRSQRFAGLPSNIGKIGQQQMLTGAVPTGNNQNKFATLQAIKMGAKKEEFKPILEANGAQAYQVPVSRPKRQEKDKSKNAVAPQYFAAKPLAQASRLEEEFLGGNSGMVSPSVNYTPNNNSLVNHNPVANVPQGQILQEQTIYGMPDFDSYAQTRLAEKGVYVNHGQPPQQYQQPTQQANYTESNSQQQQLNEMRGLLLELARNSGLNVPKQNSSPSIITEQQRKMIVDIAKKTAEDTIKAVLKEFVESQRKKPNIELVNKDKNLVRMGDDYYQMTPVKVVKH